MALHLKTATSANNLAVINKPVRVVVSRLHSTHCLIDPNGMGLGSKGPVSIGKNAALISNLYMMINSSVTACDPFQKNVFIFKKLETSKCNKDGDNNTATQSKGHSMRLP